jgi:glycosyltransferase involved in cell wall biosynthesis
MIPVSVIVMTRNEEARLPRCLAALKSFAEIFVVDSASTDGTAAVARSFGATLVPFRWNGQYPKKKQWCLENIPFSHDNVLYIDADEIMTHDLAAEIANCDFAPRHQEQ